MPIITSGRSRSSSKRGRFLRGWISRVLFRTWILWEMWDSIHSSFWTVIFLYFSMFTILLLCSGMSSPMFARICSAMWVDIGDAIPALTKTKALTHSLVESWNRGVIGYFKAITSLGNPSGCELGLVGDEYRPFHIARFRSCCPALARFARVVDAGSAERFSFVKFVDEAGTSFRWRVSAAIFCLHVCVVHCPTNFQVTIAAFRFISYGILCSLVALGYGCFQSEGFENFLLVRGIGWELVLRFASTRI